MPYTAVNLHTGETRILRDLADLQEFFALRCPLGWSIR